MQSELLRSLLLEYLRTAHLRPGLQYGDCVLGVTNLARGRCPDQLDQPIQGQYQLREADNARLTHVIWDLILERVLVPGTRSPNTGRDGWPFLSATDHGCTALASNGPVPYDPDGYLTGLNQSVGGLHPTVKRYLEESVSTFRTGNYLASAVMLGAASEMVFLELCGAIGASIASQADRRRFDERTGQRKKMVDRMATVVSWLNQKKDQLPSEWQRQEQIGVIDKVAGLIRSRRNDAGHPQDPPAVPAHEEMYALLVVFPHFCVKLYGLKKWLAEHPGTIT